MREPCALPWSGRNWSDLPENKRVYRSVLHLSEALCRSKTLTQRWTRCCGANTRVYSRAVRRAQGTRVWPFNKQASRNKLCTATSRPYIGQRPSSSPLVEFSRRQGPRGWPSLATSRRPDTVVGCAGAWLSGHSAGRWGLGRRLNPPGRGTHYLLLLADRRALSLQAWAACGTSGPVTRHGQSWLRLWRSFLKGFGWFGGMVERRLEWNGSSCGVRSGW